MTNNKEQLTEAQWAFYEENGYLLLGQVLTDEALAALQARIDDIMLGRAEIDYERLLMQREADDMTERTGQTFGFKGATVNYRKIQNLEQDPLFLTYMSDPLFQLICRKVYGADKRIATYRAMYMSKPAYYGSVLPYHQDRWTHLDRDPQVTVWTALDPSTAANGCLKIFPGTHRQLINSDNPSGFLTEAQLEQLARSEQEILLEMKPGEAVLLHNWTVHGSDGNLTSQSRRAFSVCYMDADTVSSTQEQAYTVFEGN